MSPFGGIAILCFMGAVLFLLPLVPAILELRHKTDALPLTVVQQHAGEIRFFADGFRSYLKGLQPVLDLCSKVGETTSGVMPDGTEYIVFAGGDSALQLPSSEPSHSCELMIASAGDLVLPSDMQFSKDLYAVGSLIGGENDTYRAALAEKDIYLGQGSTVMRWIHAAGKVRVDQGCRLYGRVSSDHGISLNQDCSFLRLNAPFIATDSTDVSLDASGADSAVASGPVPPRTLHDGDLQIPGGQELSGNLVVRGKLEIGDGARIRGSVKSEKELVLGSNVQIEGSLMSSTSIQIGSGCRVHGPVIAEHSMLVQSGTHFGNSQCPTTVSAPQIELETGVVVWGTLWAREQGKVARNS